MSTNATDAAPGAVKKSHLFHLAKAYGRLAYNSLYYWADSRNQNYCADLPSQSPASQPKECFAQNYCADLPSQSPARQPKECFASNYITLKAAIENVEHLRCNFRDEGQIIEFARKIIGTTMVSYQAIATLADQVRYCEEHGVAGDYVELGVWKGGCLAVMALSNMAFGSERRTIHGFNSFQGIPLPRRDKDDMVWAREEMKLTDEQCDGRLVAAEQLIGPKADVEQTLAATGYPNDRIRLHEGWFQDTVPVAEIGKIAVLRIDGDLYDSYVVALDQLYDKVQPGGFVIFDDWILEGCRRAVTEFFERRNISPYLCQVDESVRYFQKPAA